MSLLALEIKFKKPSFAIVIFIMVCLNLIIIDFNWANETQESKVTEHSVISPPWDKAMNQSEIEEKYPEKRKITPETVRLTINEYYVPEVSELLEKGVDCIEWLNQLDDPYLNRYKVDIKIDPTDERLKLFWKRDF